MDRYVIGIDTGGTFTDGVLMHYRSRKVENTSKQLTTRHDLKIGVINVLKDLKIKENYDIRLVGISSTLATNSIAEERARKVGLLLIGYDRQLIKDYKLFKKFATDTICYADGGHNAQGIEKMPLDEERIRKWLSTVKHKIDAVAISSYFSPLNTVHEDRAFEIIKEETDLPVVLGNQLTSKIDSVKRAATASINASLVAVMKDFIEAVQNALAEKNIKAPLMIVRGDGTLMPCNEAIEKPVETVLSGPAASAIGGHFLSRKGNSLVIDVGSTTTDMALVQDSRVVVSEDGARVGNTETAVEAGSIRTVSIGCDSSIFLDKYNKIQVGPDKSTPISQLAMRYKEVAEEIYNLEISSNEARYFTDIQYWHLYNPLEEHRLEELLPIQKKVIELISEKPKRLTDIVKEAGVYHPEHLKMQELIQQGYIECANLTPSDLFHAEGALDLWDSKVARIALSHVSGIPHLNNKKFIEQTVDKIVSKIVEEIIIYLACQGLPKGKMPMSIQDAWGKWMLNETLKEESDFISLNIDSRVPIIGTGAPAELFLKRAAHHVNAHFILPEHYGVANAVGAVSGSIMETREAIVFNQATGETFTYVVKSGNLQESFEEYEDACDFAEEKARERAKEAIVEAGAVDPFIELKHKKDGSLHRFVARAVGNPKISDKEALKAD